MGRIVWMKRIGLYIVGIFVLAMGVSFSVKSNLGVSPVSSVPYVMSRILGISLGGGTFVVYLFCMALQALVLRRDYKPKYLLQIVFSMAFGYFTDLTTAIITFLPVSGNYALRGLYLALGTAMIALGIMLYLSTDLVALPTDGTVQSISIKGKFRIDRVKIIYDCVSTALALSLSLIFLGRVDGVGIGTVVASLGIGRLLGMFMSLLGGRVEAFLKPAPPASDRCVPEVLPPGKCPPEKAG